MNLEESELAQYCSFIKKGSTGKLGSTAVELEPEINLLEPLRDSELKNEEQVKSTAMKIMDTYASQENYSIFFAYGECSMPSANSDTEEVYRFILAMIQPCCLEKPGITYDSPQNEFSAKKLERELGASIHSFLYPALDDLHTDIDHAMFFTKSEKTASDAEDLVMTVFNTKIPLSPSGQKRGFHDILMSAFDQQVPYDAVKNIYDHFEDKLLDAQLSGNDVILSEKELTDAIIEHTDIPEEKIEEVKKTSSDFSGQKFSVENIVSRKVSIETGNSVIKTDLGDMYAIEKRMIDGREYYLVPAEHSVIDGIFISNSDSKL